MPANIPIKRRKTLPYLKNEKYYPTLRPKTNPATKVALPGKSASRKSIKALKALESLVEDPPASGGRTRSKVDSYFDAREFQEGKEEERYDREWRYWITTNTPPTMNAIVLRPFFTNTPVQIPNTVPNPSCSMVTLPLSEGGGGSRLSVPSACKGNDVGAAAFPVLEGFPAAEGDDSRRRVSTVRA